jgi:hypothetical protein
MRPKADLVLENSHIFVGLEAEFVSSVAVFGNQVLMSGDGHLLADIAVFDRDIFTVSPESILETCVAMTILDSKVVYERSHT